VKKKARKTQPKKKEAVKKNSDQKRSYTFEYPFDLALQKASQLKEKYSPKSTGSQ
jgi:hypothetical protein